MNLNDMFAEDEANALAATRAEIAAEKAAFDALPQEEKDRIIAEAGAKWDALGAAFDEAFEAACEEDEEEDDDDDE